MIERDVATRSFDGTGDLVVVAPLRDEFVAAYDSVTCETRARMAAEALHNIRLNAREYETALPFSDTTERILNVLDFRLGVLDQSLFDLVTAPSGSDNAAVIGDRTLRSRRYLLLSVTFDSGWEPYMRLIWKPLGAFLDLFFCNCEGYLPAGDTPFEQYIGWVRDAQVESAIFYSATGMTVADQLWFRQADRIITAPDRDATQATDLADLVLVQPVVAAEAFRAAHILKSVQVGLEALNVLYKLADLYPLHRHDLSDGGLPEGRHLARATHELLNGFDDLLEQFRTMLPDKAEAACKAYAEPLAWWTKGRHWLAAGGSDAVDPPLDLTEIQAGLMAPFAIEGRPANVGALLMMTIVDPAKARAFVRALPVSYEAAAAGDPTDAGFSLTIAFTPHGLVNMGLDRDTLDQWPQEFSDGMELRSGIVGDKREHHPRNWILPPRGSPLDPPDRPGPPVAMSEIDFVLQVRVVADEPADSRRLLDAIRKVAGDDGTTSGVVITAWQAMEKGGGTPHDLTRIDHFGFRDGVSQPKATPGLPPKAAIADYAVNDEVRLGELLIGYHNDRGDGPRADNGPDSWWFNSSFMVLRKIEQHADLFDQWAQDNCRRLNDQHGLTGSADALAPAAIKAYVLGRRQDGTPMIDGATDNRFNYANDPAGHQVPLASHVRRANPRIVEFGRPTPRLLRRSMSFGPPSGGVVDGQQRGIIFMAFVASIAEQYEVVQRWVNGGNSTGIPSSHSDPMLGVSPPEGDRHFQFWHAGRLMKCAVPATRIRDALVADVPAQQGFTRLHWGLYLWVPSRRALAALCDLGSASIDMDPPVASVGQDIIQRLSLLPAALRNREWKRLLEDFDSKDPGERAISPDVWLAIQQMHGGALAVDRGTDDQGQPRPAMVLVSDERLAGEILARTDIFSSSEQTRRMRDNFGLNYVTMDRGADYWAQSGVTNAIMYAQPATMGFDDGYRHAATVLSNIVGRAKGSGLTQARFDSRRQWLMPTLGLICQQWFGLPGSTFMDLGGLDFDPARDKARCPGDFISASRYIFNPDPSAELVAIGRHHGRLIHSASRAFVDAYRSHPDGVPGTLAAPMFDAIADNDLLARNLSGMMLGMLAPIEANLRGVLHEWLYEQSLWRHQAAYLRARAARDGPDHDAARRALAKPILKAMSKRPAPDMLYRTVAQEHLLATADDNGPALSLKPGDLVIVSLASITQQRLALGKASDTIIFGGVRRGSGPCPYRVGTREWPNADQADDAPLHACPAHKLMTGAISGIIAALCDAGAIRPMPAGLVIGIDIEQ